MKAIVIHSAHDLRVEPFEPAADPAVHEVQVAITNGGICGSDLHYYHAGGFGAVRIKEPMALGHEVSGRVIACGSGVEELGVGDKVAINPSRPCDRCHYCLNGQRNQCLDMRFNGSAMRFPHENGLFRQVVTVDAAQVVKVSASVDLAHAAMCEPLAVCLHAVSRAGDLKGKRVLVSGCGPIGCLTVAAAKLAGANEIIATDISDGPLAIAVSMGATATVNLEADADDMMPLTQGKGQIDTSFECSGAPSALSTVLAATRAGGTVVLVGMGGDVPLPLGVAVAKEINLHGTFRFDTEFEQAARLIERCEIDLSPMITSIYDMSEAEAAFAAASDRQSEMKVQIGFPAL